MKTSKDSQEEVTYRERIYFYNLHKCVNTNKMFMYAIWKMYFPTIEVYNFLHLKKILSFYKYVY